MDRLREEIAAEEENIKTALDNLKKVIRRKSRTVIELVAMASFISNIYNGIENILKRVIKIKGESIQNTENWHKHLIEVSVETGVISEELAVKLYDYLGFRHFFIHGYGFRLNWDKMKSLVENTDELWKEIKRQLADYMI